MNECWLYNDCSHKDCDNDFCVRKYKLDKLYNLSLLPPLKRVRQELIVEQGSSDVQKFKELAAIEADIIKFVQNGNNLYITSPQCGNGKTSWAIRLLQAYLNKTWARADVNTCKVLFIDVNKFLIELKGSISRQSEYAEHIRQNVLSADLVVWDDIATKVGTDYEISFLLNYLNDRISSGKANIYTSNINPANLYAVMGERLASRVINASSVITLEGADKRGYKQGENING